MGFLCNKEKEMKYLGSITDSKDLVNKGYVDGKITALDGSVTGTPSSSATLTAFSETDGVVSATFGSISITKSQISDFPTIPTVNDATLTIQKNSTNVATFTANASSNVTANITVPTTASDVSALPISGGTVTGSLKINNHSSAIGTVKSAYASAKSVATATNTNLTSISLEAGTWVVTGGVRFPNNATGLRRMNISTSSASEWADVQLPAASGGSTQLAYTVIVSPSATTTYYLNCYHNAGSALSLIAGGGENGANFLRAVRIA